MSARDDLMQIIAWRFHAANPRPTVLDAAVADAIIAAGYVKAEPEWAETLTNDGTYEYTISSDCDGSSVTYWRRKPGKTYHEQPHSWERYDPGHAEGVGELPAPTPQ